MAEWLKAHAWKACIGETLSRVRIPVSPPETLGPAKPTHYLVFHRRVPKDHQNQLASALPLCRAHYPGHAAPRALPDTDFLRGVLLSFRLPGDFDRAVRPGRGRRLLLCRL